MPRAPELLIRADAGVRIGLGHLGRTLALAQAWRSLGGTVRFAVVAPIEAAIAAWVEREGFAVSAVDGPRFSPRDVAATIAAARSASWIVLDAYAPPEYRSALEAAGLRILAIDDLGGELHAALVVNPNPGAAADLYSATPSDRLRLGPRYALLRAEFGESASTSRKIEDRARRILVSLGGSDPDNLSLRVLRAVDRLPGRDVTVKVVLGPANPHETSLVRQANGSGDRVELVRNPSSMARCYAWADVAVMAGGGSALEALCLGTPLLGLCLAENQRRGAEALRDLRCWRYLGIEPDEETIAAALAALLDDAEERLRLSTAGQALVDGRGALRLAEELAATA